MTTKDTTDKTTIRVRAEQAVRVPGHGPMNAGATHTVEENPSVHELIAAGALTKQKPAKSGTKED